MLRRCIFYVSAKGLDSNDGGQNAAKITLLDFTFTCHIPEWIWFVEQLLWTFCAEEFLKGTILSSKICVIKHQGQSSSLYFFSTPFLSSTPFFWNISNPPPAIKHQTPPPAKILLEPNLSKPYLLTALSFSHST